AVVLRRATRRDCEPPRLPDCLHALREALPDLHVRELRVVHARAPHRLFIDIEPERRDQMQPCAGVGAHADAVAGVRRDLRLLEDAVKHRGVSVNYPPMLPASLSLDFCSLKLDSPIVLLSGCVGFGEEYTRVEGFTNRDAGAIVLKGATREPRLGNAPHRVYE